MADAPYKLILLRHGESEWNAKNLFTGWVDVNLNDKGEKEAVRGGELLKDAGLLPDVVHTSLQKRAIRTAQLSLEAADRHWIPVHRSWRLNERHYGALQGKDKAQTLAEFGEEQFMLWRRSYDTPPPPLEDGTEFSQSDDPRYATIPPELRPRTECLKDVVVRMLPYWYDGIVPDLLAGRTVLVAAHGNSPPSPRQAPRRHLGRGHRGPEHPDGDPACIRTGRVLQAGEAGGRIWTRMRLRRRLRRLRTKGRRSNPERSRPLPAICSLVRASLLCWGRLWAVGDIFGPVPRVLARLGRCRCDRYADRALPEPPLNSACRRVSSKAPARETGRTEERGGGRGESRKGQAS